MFSSPHSYSKFFIEADVIVVDSTRGVCQIRTSNGQIMYNVPWLLPVGGGLNRHGIYTTPMLGEHVAVSVSLGYPIIIGSIPRPGVDTSYGVGIDDGNVATDTGNYSSMGSGGSQSLGRPTDAVVGDHVLATEGGSLLAVLRGGSIVMKASMLAQIFISKLDDIVRVVGRNWELFTDTFMDVSVNVRNRIYRFTGYSNNLVEGRINKFKYYEIHGDTALGDYLQGYYHGADPSTFPVATTTLKSQIVMAQDVEPPIKVHVENIDEDGSIDRVISRDKNLAHFNMSRYHWTVDTTDGTVKAKVEVKPASIVITWNEKHTITLDANQIFADFEGKTTVLLNASQGTMTHGSAVTTVNDSEASTKFGGHFMIVNGSGVQLG